MRGDDGRPSAGHPIDDALRALGRELAPALRCGPYLLAHHVASGAVGDIFAATRDGDEGALRHAVKLMRAGPEAGETLARFERERNLLRSLAHPAVVQVVDDGALPDGRLWFAMPLIDGGAITTECDERRADLGTRLALFAQVCGAVDAVHQAGVVHRDLKPCNILVESRGGTLAPHIVDFGIARALLSPHARMTPLDVAHRLGTPEYMSPEHWEYGVGACDARSDVFALGVVLGALCAGVIPRVGGGVQSAAEGASGAGRGSDDAPRSASRRRRTRPGAICAPSAALRELALRDPAAAREIAAFRGLAKSEELAKVLELRVDAIVMRACSAEPTHRHESAASLGVEVRAAL